MVKDAVREEEGDRGWMPQSNEPSGTRKQDSGSAYDDDEDPMALLGIAKTVTPPKHRSGGRSGSKDRSANRETLLGNLEAMTIWKDQLTDQLKKVRGAYGDKHTCGRRGPHALP